MKKIKIGLVVACLLIVCGLEAASKIYADDTESPLNGKIIALDAGHGYNGATGAVGYCGDLSSYVNEVEVNLAVRERLTVLLTASEQGATVFWVPQLDTRREPVATAEEAGADILISIHHNGSFDTTVDYTETFITQTRFDKPLAEFIHPALVSALNLPSRGITNSGFGMTVFGDHPALLTEAYFITNTEAACDYLSAEGIRVEAEAQGLYNGILNYFSSGGEIFNPGKRNQ